MPRMHPRGMTTYVFCEHEMRGDSWLAGEAEAATWPTLWVK